jgi:hypothetical protein
MPDFPFLHEITALILAITKLIVALKGTIGVIGKVVGSFRKRSRQCHD